MQLLKLASELAQQESSSGANWCSPLKAKGKACSTRYGLSTALTMCTSCTLDAEGKALRSIPQHQIAHHPHRGTCGRVTLFPLRLCVWTSSGEQPRCLGELSRWQSMASLCSGTQSCQKGPMLHSTSSRINQN